MGYPPSCAFGNWKRFKNLIVESNSIKAIQLIKGSTVNHLLHHCGGDQELSLFILYYFFFLCLRRVLGGLTKKYRPKIPM